MRFDVELTPEPEGGYTVVCPLVKGAVSYGKTVEEALDMIKDAIEGILEVRGELEKYAPIEIGEYKVKTTV
jgi:predicted RNase H-like HicB family nuclease